MKKKIKLITYQDSVLLTSIQAHISVSLKIMCKIVSMHKHCELLCIYRNASPQAGKGNQRPELSHVFFRGRKFLVTSSFQ